MSKEIRQENKTVDSLAAAREEFAGQKLTDPQYQIQLKDEFSRQLDWLFSLPESERIRVLGGIDPNNQSKTMITPKRWADETARRKIINSISSLITDDEAKLYLQNVADSKTVQDKKQKEKSILQLAERLSLSVKSTDIDTLMKIEEIIDGISSIPPVNRQGLRRIFLTALLKNETVTGIYIRCLRFAYPFGKPFIIPNLDDYSYVDKYGHLINREGRAVDSWIENTLKLSQQLEVLGIAFKPFIVIADTDLPDVRAFAPGSHLTENAESFIENFNAKYSQLTVKTASELEISLKIQNQYRDLFYSAAAFLLTGTSNSFQNALGLERTLLNYGFDRKFVDLIKKYCARNASTNFKIPVNPLTLERASEEERASQLRSLPQERCQLGIITIYTCLRIARDIAQIGVLFPAISENSIYISDRSLKAVDFGYIGNKIQGKEKLPTIFQNYEE